MKYFLNFWKERKDILASENTYEFASGRETSITRSELRAD
jgi:hypothetical protein